MDTREKITELLINDIADVFMLDKDYVATNHELNLREDLVANSMQYFPIITDLEEALEIDIDFHEFQNEAKTIKLAIDYILNLYNVQHQ